MIDKQCKNSIYNRTKCNKQINSQHKLLSFTFSHLENRDLLRDGRISVYADDSIRESNISYSGVCSNNILFMPSMDRNIHYTSLPQRSTYWQDSTKPSIKESLPSDVKVKRGFFSKLQAKILDYYHKCIHYYYDFTDKEKIFHYASSLSFYNIFSIIPLFLVFMSIVASFPIFQNQVRTFKELILNNILPENADEISLMLDTFLLNGKEMGLIGFLVALVSSFFFFRNFDDISARIFTAKKRSVFDSFIIYWLLVTLIPIFFVTSIYFSATVSSKYLNVFSELSKVMPMFMTWLAFGILFRIAANKSIRFVVLGFSSFLGAGIWYMFRSIFVYYMGYNQFYKNIYGSISIIMFIFLWIYISWLVVLVSMRLCKKLDDRFPNY